MAHPIHKHMHTHITKQNVKAAIRDDKAHMDYLKRDVKDDQRAGGKYKDINQTADEKHISKLAGDVKYDEKKEGMSRESSYQQAKNLMKYNPTDDIAGMSRKSKTTKNKTVKVGKSTIEVDEKGKFGKVKKMDHIRKDKDDLAGKSRPVPKKKDGKKNPPKKSEIYGSGVSRKISKKAAERKVKRGKGKIEEKTGGKDTDARYVSNRRQKRADKAREDGGFEGLMKSFEIKGKSRKIK
jgi:hypothetical protein